MPTTVQDLLAVPAGRATGQQTTLSARFIGYVRQNRQITLSAGNQSELTLVALRWGLIQA